MALTRPETWPLDRVVDTLERFASVRKQQDEWVNRALVGRRVALKGKVRKAFNRTGEIRVAFQFSDLVTLGIAVDRVDAKGVLDDLYYCDMTRVEFL